MISASHGASSIMMWGAKGSGKSIYLASLVYWSPPPDDDRRSCVLPADSAAAEWVSSRIRSLQRQRDDRPYSRPSSGAPANGEGTSAPVMSSNPAINAIYKTMAERRLEFRLYTLPSARNGRGSHVGLPRLLGHESKHEANLSFWDVPGEIYDGEIPPNILAEMMRARGLILLINPSYVPEEGRDVYYMRFFDRTLGRLKFALADADRRGERVPFDRKTNQITLPVAVCLSQIDRSPAFMEAEPKALFEEVVGDTAPILYSWLTTFDIFKLTALGKPLKRTGDREYLEGNPDPKFVHLPISWIVSLGDDTAKRRAQSASGGNR